MSDAVPVAIFCYNRPRHLAALLESFDACVGRDRTQPIVFCDGPRDAADATATGAVQTLAREWAAKSGAVVEISPGNRGLAASVVHGVSAILERSDRVIVLEDDLVLAPAFLQFHLDGLERYAEAGNVYQISGYQWFDLPRFAPAFFAPLTTTWGWSTWRRAWKELDLTATGRERLDTDAAFRKCFNIGDRLSYSGMLKDRFEAKNSSWGILWYWSVFSRGGLVLYPPRNLVVNLGFDGSGTHCGDKCGTVTSLNPQQPSARIRLPRRIHSSRLRFQWMKREIYRQCVLGAR